MGIWCHWIRVPFICGSYFLRCSAREHHHCLASSMYPCAWHHSMKSAQNNKGKGANCPHNSVVFVFDISKTQKVKEVIGSGERQSNPLGRKRRRGESRNITTFWSNCCCDRWLSGRPTLFATNLMVTIWVAQASVALQTEMLQKSENQWRSSKWRNIAQSVANIGCLPVPLNNALMPIITFIFCSGRNESTHNGKWIFIVVI